MPLETGEIIRITCDNSKCPGNTLDEKTREGWFFVSGEVYMKGPTTQMVYCSSKCLSEDADSVYVLNPIPEVPAPAVVE